LQANRLASLNARPLYKDRLAERLTGHDQQIADAVTVDAEDRSAELGLISGSHAVLTLVHLSTQPELDPVGDVEPM